MDNFFPCFIFRYPIQEVSDFNTIRLVLNFDGVQVQKNSKFRVVPRQFYRDN